MKDIRSLSSDPLQALPGAAWSERSSIDPL